MKKLVPGKKDKTIYILSGITLLLSGFMTFINFSEFVTIGILKQTSGYPFGTEGPVPWYYETAELYAKVNLFFGILFLATLIITAWAILTRDKRKLFITLLSTISLIIIMYVNGQTG